MIYVLGRVTRNSKLIGFMCADLDIGAVSNTKGALSPEFKMLSLADMLDAVSKTATQLKKDGRPSAFANTYNKNNIDNLEVVNGILSSETFAVFPTLDFYTRDIIPNTSRGIILREYTSYDTGKRLGFCLALYNREKALFDVGRTNTTSLLSYIQKAQEDGYNFVSNAQLSLDEDSGLLVITPTNQGYSQLKIMNETSEGTVKKLSKIQANKIVGDKKKLGTSTSTMMKNIAEAAADITQEQDLFANCTPSQIELIQRYYMEYTRQIFESLKKTSRLDISPEKLAKLDMYRISSNYTWEYRGIVLGGKKGDYRCALGHKLSRAHIAECKDVKDEKGKNLRVLFGSTCVADFFQLDSGDIPVLSKAESVMVDEVGIIVEAINQGKVAEKWEKVSLLRHFVETLDAKQTNYGQNVLDQTVGKQAAAMLRLFIRENIPFPKSLTEMVLMNLKYQYADPVSYRLVFHSFLKRKTIEKDDLKSVVSKDQMILFRSYFGEEQYNLLLKYFPFMQTIFEFIISSKLQGEYGWDPENRSTGFRGMHNANIKRRYYAYDRSCRTVFGFNEYTGEEFKLFAQLMQWYIELSEPVRQMEREITDIYSERYQVQKVLNTVLSRTGYDRQHDYCLLVALIRGISRKIYGEYSEGNSTYLNIDMSVKGADSLYNKEEPISNIIHNYYITRTVSAQNIDNQLLSRTVAQMYQHTTEYKDKMAKMVAELKKLTKRAGVLKEADVEYAAQEMKKWRNFKEATIDAESLSVDISGTSSPRLKLSTASFDFTFNYETARYMLVADSTTEIMNLADTSLPIIMRSTEALHEPTLMAIPANQTLDGEPELILGDSDKQVLNIKYKKDGTVLIKLIDGKTIHYKRVSMISNTKEESLNYIAENVGEQVTQSNRQRLYNMANNVINSSEEELVGYSLSGSLKDGIKLLFKDFKVGITLNRDYFEPLGILAGKYKLDLDINGEKREVIQVYQKSNNSNRYEADYRYLPKGFQLKVADNSTPILDIKFDSNEVILTPGLDSHGAVIYKVGGTQETPTQHTTAQTPQKTAKQPTKQTASKTGKAGHAQDLNEAGAKPDEREIYTRVNPPEEYDKDNVVHALINAYQQVGLKYSSKHTVMVKKALSTGKDYSVMRYQDKNAIQDELANLVSVGADVSEFNLPFKLNTFVKSADEPETFAEVKKMYTALFENIGDYEYENQKVINILGSIIKYDKLTERQRPYIVKARELYNEQ